jgi:hypothetical protein
MKPLQRTKVFPSIPPTAIKDDADFVAVVVDTKDLTYIEFIGCLGATDIAMATNKIMGSDTKTDDNTLGGTPELILDMTTKPTATDDGTPHVIGIDLVAKARPRYLLQVAKAGNGSAGSFYSSIAIGQQQGPAGTSAADRGVSYAEYA